MIYRKYIIIFLLGVFCFTDCKKYPEGPLISFRSKEQRVVGTWYIDKYLVNGVDSTDSKYFMQNPYECYIGFNVTGASLGSHSVSSKCDSAGGKWEFADDKTCLVFKKISRIGPLFLMEGIKWKIMKLKFKEMHLQVEFNSKKYDFYLYRNSK